MVTFDEELRAQNERLRAAAGIRTGERVLDVGCGAGQTTREAARAAAPGAVLGVDLSAQALERARQRTAAEGLRNVTYEQADAQVHRFEPEGFDVAISRFGVMFFADPDAAFANIARALRPGGRLVALVWQPRGDNAWAVAIDAAFDEAPGDESAFSLGDRAVTEPILARAGFDEIRFDDVDEPVFYGADVEEALAWVQGFRYVDDALAGLGPADRDRVLARLRDTLAAHHSADRGVLFDARVWLIDAVSRPRGTGRRSAPSSRAAG
jgi:ubiquinone/menaquinone biosynthesis C-methylase UbiE